MSVRCDCTTCRDPRLGGDWIDPVREAHAARAAEVDRITGRGRLSEIDYGLMAEPVVPTPLPLILMGRGARIESC